MPSEKTKQSKYILFPKEENLNSIPFHKDRKGINRISYLDENLLKGSPLSIAVHDVNVSKRDGETHTTYAEMHQHDTDEVNVIIPSPGKKLVYKITLDDEEYLVEGPASVLIQSGLKHKAEAVFGHGQFVCIKLLKK